MASTGKRWTVARKRTLETWINSTKEKLALGDWTIQFNWEGNEFTHPLHGNEVSAFATITPFPSSKHAALSVSPALLELEKKEQVQVLVHELVHCHLFAIHEYAEASFTLAAGRNKLASELHSQALVQHVESTTDALADAFAAFALPIDLA